MAALFIMKIATSRVFLLHFRCDRLRSGGLLVAEICHPRRVLIKAEVDPLAFHRRPEGEEPIAHDSVRRPFPFGDLIWRT